MRVPRRHDMRGTPRNKSFFGSVAILSALILAPLAQTHAQQHRTSPEHVPASEWKTLATGLELGTFLSPRRSEYGDSLVRVLRIDPRRYELKLFNASATENGRPLTVKQWCHHKGLTAAVNASMYRTDFRTSVSLMRTKTHINNPRLSQDKMILAFDRQRSDVPLVKMIDRQCDDFDTWKHRYGTLIQSIRMLSCRGKNVWSPQTQKWSTAAIGMDRSDRVLFIYVGSPYSTHDLIAILQTLPLDISRAMYCEGGPQAQLYIRTADGEYEFTGGFEIKHNEMINSLAFWPIPNVVGITPRQIRLE